MIKESIILGTYFKVISGFYIGCFGTIMEPPAQLWFKVTTLTCYTSDEAKRYYSPSYVLHKDIFIDLKDVVDADKLYGPAF